MRQQKSKSNSILLQVFSGLLKVGGCLLLAYIGLIAFFTLFVMPLFFSFGIRDKQVEILLGLSASMVTNSKQVEGKQFVGSMNRVQQTYFYENNALATSVDALGLGIKTETNNYKYSTHTTETAAFNYAVAKDKTLKNYVGGVFLVPAQKLDPNARRDEMMTVTILCETEKRPFFRVKRTDEPDEQAEPIYQNGEVICGKGTTELTR
ncbi:type IV pilin-like G/H family protein [Microcoleus sp. A2-C5]|uniref:type IV pilin-like G/H family protein n=1 Tax=Microcoleaceae TaxID=1892252 RepID=UPI00223720A4|nr:type IV pilin-like G/H family protein [Lyngbya sp. CCAP 1446/10]MCW6051916.1 type IV pilin-like G/H family protein [Lyngbya sp. CCAP 1446/10]